jgi:DNA (cytosine-5)-methyltransferase 1
MKTSRLANQIFLDLGDELIVDNFAGGGGASTGIEMAFGRPVDIAINHDPEAIALHKINHPDTKHYCESVWDVDPREACAGRPVGLAWFSPDCKHFSKAKGGSPVDKKIRGLAWIAVKWAAAVRPRVIMLENVEEFKTWGPIAENGKPCPIGKGKTFKIWVKQLEELGYVVEWRELAACNYGAPTTRKRLFLIARCDGQPIDWPEETHGPGLEPYKAAADCIDWEKPCPSIFERKRPLADATMSRIAQGIKKFIIDDPDPFMPDEESTAVLSRICQTGWKHNPARSMRVPLSTIVSKNEHILIRPVLGKSNHNTRAFITKYFSCPTGQNQSLKDPLHTIRTKSSFGLVTVKGRGEEISDIGMRMLTPRELYRAQGFPDSYIINFEYNGRKLTQAVQTRCVGNSVVPLLSKALVSANFNERSMEKAA